MKIFLIYILFVYSISSFAVSHVGMIIKKQGKAELLTNPSKKINSKGKKVLYEGTYYTIKKVKPGVRIHNGNILRTGNKSKVKVVFKNGDQFNIGQATAYKISWKKKDIKNIKGSTVNLIYGSIRGIISKKGPRNNLKVKSKNAVMGVRGTDFHFTQKGTSGSTSISVLRGKVDVANVEKPKEILKVKQGFSAELQTTILLEKKDKKVIPKNISKFEIIRTTKQDLVHIQKDSKIIEKKSDKTKSKKIQKEIDNLEKSAVKVTLEDIKEYQPEVYKELKDKKIKSIDTVNTIVISKAFKKAPIKKSKKGFDEFDLNLEEDAYKKYFKVDEKF